MIKEKRQKLILDFVRGKEFVTHEEIAENFHIPSTTLRRDITDLDKQKKIKKVHGGVQEIKETQLYEEALNKKLHQNIEAKKNIAKKALDCIKPNETIYLDSGSTTYFLAKILPNDMNIKVYTNSIISAQELFSNGFKEVYILGGKIKDVTGAIVGAETVSQINTYNFDLAFIGINAMDAEGFLYTTNIEEAKIKETVIKNSYLCFGLIDTTKFNSKSFIKFSKKNTVTIISEVN
ncbi:DeoR/GlpR family DNA-binding transcription regulator [Spiroplasma endosymbiont of Crioceris asparagi]|uniref:DeoR/GlpR family DNA-binding transcription regulator n=1 Tax=Spiroplasma endosymbiont of Crioceris asparagi TaxID=3066286 RepID=UPI0030D29A5D